MKHSKLLCLVLALVFVLGLAAPAMADGLSAAGEYPIWTGDEPYVLKVLVAYNAHVSDWDDNTFTKWVEEKCNVDLQFEFLPEVEPKQKLIIDLDTNEELPDVVIYGLSVAEAYNYGSKGKFVNLKEFFDEGVMVQCDSAVERFPTWNLITNITNSDGSIYAVPKIQASPQNETKYKLWINKTYLDNLGTIQNEWSSANRYKCPAIYPDYVNVTIPVNIAPLTFEADQPADEMVASYTVGDQVVVCGGQMQPEMDEWRELTAKAKGGAIKVDVYMCKDDKWTRYKPFNLYVSPDSIDPYISYRLISPSFIAYETLTINQRCLENYDESVIYDNFLCGFEKDGQCINCHHYQNYHPQRMQFHARQFRGGTLVAYDGKMKKVNMTI